MAAKMTADPGTRIITVTEAPVGGFQTLNVVDDIYEALKDDWHGGAALQNLRFPFRSFGDPKTATSQIGPYVFFNNVAGWRFLPFDGDHELTIGGNLVAESSVAGFSLPVFLPRPGRTVIVPFETSAQALTNLVETGVSGLTAPESQSILDNAANLATIAAQIAAFQIRPPRGVLLDQLPVFLVQAVDHISPATGKLGSLTIMYKKAHTGSWTPCIGPFVDQGNGWYSSPMTAAEMDAEFIMIRAFADATDIANLSLMTAPAV